MGVTQRILSQRADGHDSKGNPGDCLKCCVATVMGLPYHQVPHFAQYLSWWDTLRRWTRDNHDGDWACFSTTQGETPRDFLEVGSDANLFVGVGPSPRGSFNHCVVVDQDLKVVWDPNPDRLGVPEVFEVFIWTFPYLPGPKQLLIGGER